MTLNEAAAQAKNVLDDTERMRRESLEAEHRFMRRQSFLLYGEDALLLGLHLNTMSDADFVTRYNVPKDEVFFHMNSLEDAITTKDFSRRNILIDLFIDLLG